MAAPVVICDAEVCGAQLSKNGDGADGCCTWPGVIYIECSSFNPCLVSVFRCGGGGGGAGSGE